MEKLKDVDRILSEMCAQDNFKILKEACQGLACDEGGVNATKLWQLKRKLRGVALQPPTAMVDFKGNLVTNN